MDDRISDPWGERTPYGAGEEWPVRVDEHQAASELTITAWDPVSYQPVYKVGAARVEKEG
jgi:hypothetical protein